jgi:hypothetical protein
MGTSHSVTAAGGLVIGGTATVRVVRNLAMTPDAAELLDELARKTGLSEGDVIRLALGMFKTAVEAKERGKHVGVASNPETLDVELVGF